MALRLLEVMRFSFQRNNRINFFGLEKSGLSPLAGVNCQFLVRRWKPHCLCRPKPICSDFLRCFANEFKQCRSFLRHQSHIDCWKFCDGNVRIYLWKPKLRYRLVLRPTFYLHCSGIQFHRDSTPNLPDRCMQQSSIYKIGSGLFCW